jgi:hypothetical protein
MNRDTLTLLGCSSSLAFLLVAGSSANANAALLQEESISATASTQVTPEAQTTVPASRSNSQYSSLDPNSDTVGDLAIAKFKCDCPACRMAVVQMLQTGQLSI